MLIFLIAVPKCPTDHHRRKDLVVEIKWWDVWLYNLSIQEAESPGWNRSQPVTLRCPPQRLTASGWVSTPKGATNPQHSTNSWGPSVYTHELVGEMSSKLRQLLIVTSFLFGEILGWGFWCGAGMASHWRGIQSISPCHRSSCGYKWPRHRPSKYLPYILYYEVIWCQLKYSKVMNSRIIHRGRSKKPNSRWWNPLPPQTSNTLGAHLGRQIYIQAIITRQN